MVNDVIYHYFRNGDPLLTEEYHMMEYPPQILEELFRRSSLKIAASYGNYDLSPLQPGSPKQIYLLQTT